MTMHRKHRLVVDITLSSPCTEQEAMDELRRRLPSASLDADEGDGSNFHVKSFQRVVTTLKLKWIAKALRNYQGTSVRDTLYLMRSS